ncbi:MAG TPA: hypothetical protein VMY39_08790, partial [Planctomycetota bacterium]|nr:hypothetical protein [Planctomycetota bacterium]
MSETPLANDRRSTTRAAWPWALLPAALAVAMVAPALTSGTFVNDPASVLRNPVVSTWRNLPVIFSRSFMIHTDGQYRPMSYGLLAVVRTWVSADHTVFWHAWLAAFHALGAMLVFLLVMHFSRKTWAALVAGCLFAVHPMTVLYTSHMNTFVYVLAGTLYLATLFAYFRFVRSRRPATFVLALVLFASGLVTSKMLLTLPALLVLYELLYEREGLWAGLRRLVPLGVCVLAAAPLRLWLTPHPMFFSYPLFPSGSEAYSAWTFLGRTGVHLQGVLAGYGFEAPLDERTRWILGVGDERFLSAL